jgi:hypothetical protein
MLDSEGVLFYFQIMTKLLEEAIDELRRLTPEEQDAVAHFLLTLTSREPLTPEEIAALDEAEAEIARAEVVKGEDLKAFWRSLGL